MRLDRSCTNGSLQLAAGNFAGGSASDLAISDLSAGTVTIELAKGGTGETTLQ